MGGIANSHHPKRKNIRTGTTVHKVGKRVKKEVLVVVVMEALNPAALTVADLRKQESRVEGEQGEYYLGEIIITIIKLN